MEVKYKQYSSKMGQEFSCMNNVEIKKGISIKDVNRDIKESKPKISPLHYMAPISFARQVVSDHEETFDERTCRQFQEDKCSNEQNVPADKQKESEPEALVQKIKVKWDQFIKMKTRKFSEDYNVLGEIGKGGFGCVYRVTMKNGGILRAAKKISKSKLKVSEHESLLAEMAIMKKLDHPNITKLFEVYDQKDYYIMVMELCEGGELFDRIVSRKIKEPEAKLIMVQILNALHYLHSVGIVHRDIKPQNMLFEAKTKLVKIIDFGISSHIKPGQFLNTRVGTPYYIAPEVLNKHYDCKSDIWSLGIVLFMIIYNCPPFSGSDPGEVMRNVLKNQITFKNPLIYKFSQLSLSFLSQLLEKDPQKRPSATQALRHEWLKIESTKDNSKQPQNGDALRRITHFHFKSKLQAVVHTYIVSQLLSSEERAELLGLFQSIDKNGNGIIEAEQIKAVLSSMHFQKIDDEKIKKIIDFVDTNCSGEIDYTEFLVATIDFGEKVNQKHFEQAFEYFDIDKSGEITFQEVAEFLGNETSHEELKKMFMQYDKNGDGIISKEEFVSLLIKQKTESIK